MKKSDLTRINETLHFGVKQLEDKKWAVLCVHYCCDVISSEIGNAITFRTNDESQPHLVLKRVQVASSGKAEGDESSYDCSPSIHFCLFCGASVRFTEGTETVLAELHTRYPATRDAIERLDADESA